MVSTTIDALRAVRIDTEERGIVVQSAFFFQCACLNTATQSLRTEDARLSLNGHGELVNGTLGRSGFAGLWRRWAVTFHQMHMCCSHAPLRTVDVRRLRRPAS